MIVVLWTIVKKVNEKVGHRYLLKGKSTCIGVYGIDPFMTVMTLRRNGDTADPTDVKRSCGSRSVSKKQLRRRQAMLVQLGILT